MKIGNLGVGDRWNRRAKSVPPLPCVRQGRGSRTGVPPVRIEKSQRVNRAPATPSTAENKTRPPIAPPAARLNFGRLGGLGKVELRAAAGQSNESVWGYSPSASCRRPAAAGSSGTGVSPVRIKPAPGLSVVAPISRAALRPISRMQTLPLSRTPDFHAHPQKTICL
jgi:hypothetical protein